MKALAATLLATCVATAQATDCPPADEVSQAHLLGTWQASIDGLAPFTLALVKHPEFAGTVRGRLQRGGQEVELAGDVDDGHLTLEESLNGRNISATWLGEVVEGSCGREIRGTWQAEGAREPHPFVLQKR